MTVKLEGLDDFNPSSFMGGNKSTNTGILLAPIEKFHEDPENPRKIFNEQALNELVESIKSINSTTGEPQGILQPLSVREHPTIKGAFQINGGSRRYRAAKIAGLKELPYFINNKIDASGKVVDNLIREGFELVEMAEYIKGQFDLGVKSGEIAKRLGKKAAYVSDYLAYSIMNESIKRLLENGHTKSIQVLATLHRASKKYPDEVEMFCNSVCSHVTYSQVTNFVAGLKKNITNNPLENLEENEEKITATKVSPDKPVKEQVKKSRLNLMVEYNKEKAILLIRESKRGYGWIKLDGGEETQVKLNELSLLGFE